MAIATIVDVLGSDKPEVRDADKPLLYADDLAAVRGDGVFETLILRGGAVRNMDRHADRFISSAKMLEMPKPDIARWEQATNVAVEEYLATHPDSSEAALRWVYSRGRESIGEPTGWITVIPVGDAQRHARTNGVRVKTAERGFRLDLSERSPWALIGAKTLSYAANMAALRAAKAEGYDDVIFISDEGFVLEGPTSSVIVAKAGKGDKLELSTPSPHAGILPGTSQAAVFRVASEKGWAVTEEDLTYQDLEEADGIWLVSSVRIQARVTQLDGKECPRPGFADALEELITDAVTQSS